MDKGSLYNYALAYLGKPPYEAGTPEAKAVAEIAQHCLALAFDNTAWSFATRRAVLKTDENEHWAELPDDCLRVLKVDVPSYELIGNRLYAGEVYEHVTLDYVTNEYVEGERLPDNQPMFCEAVALMLAAKIAPRVTSDFGIAAEFERRSRDMLAKAKLKDARQWASNDQEPAVWRGMNRRGGAKLPANVLVE